MLAQIVPFSLVGVRGGLEKGSVLAIKIRFCNFGKKSISFCQNPYDMENPPSSQDMENLIEKLIACTASKQDLDEVRECCARRRFV